MIVDAETLRARQRDRVAARGRRRRRDQARAHGVGAGDLDDPAPNTARGRRASCARCAHQVRETAAGRGLAIGSAGTHPFAMWEDQRIVARPRYRELITALRFVARQELIFGMHVHVGVDDPDKAIHVANGMRVHLAVLLALSANSPFWRADATGLMSTRTPIFRAFPRVGIPPHYDDWADYEREIAFMVDSRRDGGLHLPLVRRPAAPALRHGRGPRVRLADARGAHARARRARPGDGQGALRALRLRRARSAPIPGRCSTRTSGWPPATASTASSSTCPPASASATQALARRLLDRLREHAQDLGSAR